MAIVSNGFELNVTLVDSGLDTSTLRYDLRKTTYADALTDAQVIVGRLSAITRAAVKSYSVVERFSENAMSLPQGVNIEERATIVLLVDSTQPGKTATIGIPAPLGTMFVAQSGAGANDIKPDHEALVEYVSTWRTGASGLAFISDGETVSAANNGILKGKRTHRSSSYG